MLLGIYLDGFLTGASTLAVTCGATPPEADAAARKMADAATGDPAVMEVLREEIRDRLAGVDNGPRMLRIHTLDEGAGS